MKPLEITEDIFMVAGPELTDPRDGSVYLLALDELVLIDAGAGWSVDGILRNIRTLGFDPARVSRILLTHAHIDHIGGAPEIRRRTGARLFIHGLDALAVEEGDPVRTAADWYRTAFPPTEIDGRWASAEETLEIGGQKIVILHTPGHTPGSVSIWLDRAGMRILFAQDLHGPLMEAFGSNLPDWDRSTRKLLDLEADILCEGHFGVYRTKGAVRAYIESYRDRYGE
jgi:glyoxylase-like metal-dependent hydrolase (beta-lactamase superfamily II)